MLEDLKLQSFRYKMKSITAIEFVDAVKAYCELPDAGHEAQMTLDLSDLLLRLLAQGEWLSDREGIPTEQFKKLAEKIYKTLWVLP